jgi:hypothetical protein
VKYYNTSILFDGAGYNLKQGAIHNPEINELENSDFLRNRLIVGVGSGFFSGAIEAGDQVGATRGALCVGRAMLAVSQRLPRTAAQAVITRAALIFSNPTPSARPIYSVDSFECSVVDVGNFRDYISNIEIDGVGLETLDFLKEK